MDIIKLRTLKIKSILPDWSKYRGKTIEYVLKIKPLELIDIYYNVNTITFDAEILKLLNITGQNIINKPGKDNEKYRKFISSKGCKVYIRKERFSTYMEGLGRDRVELFWERKPPSSNYLMRINHGHK